MSNASAEMPKYVCYKTVWALKIARIERDGSVNLIHPSDPKYAPVVVTNDWLDKHQPERGGYYVVYDGGYTSFLSAKAFEEGYTKVLS